MPLGPASTQAHGLQHRGVSSSPPAARRHAQVGMNAMHHEDRASAWSCSPLSGLQAQLLACNRYTLSVGWRTPSPKPWGTQWAQVPEGSSSALSPPGGEEHSPSSGLGPGRLQRVCGSREGGPAGQRGTFPHAASCPREGGGLLARAGSGGARSGAGVRETAELPPTSGQIMRTTSSEASLPRSRDPPRADI